MTWEGSNLAFDFVGLGKNWGDLAERWLGNRWRVTPGHRASPLHAEGFTAWYSSYLVEGFSFAREDFEFLMQRFADWPTHFPVGWSRESFSLSERYSDEMLPPTDLTHMALAFYDASNSWTLQAWTVKVDRQKMAYTIQLTESRHGGKAVPPREVRGPLPTLII